MNIMKRLNILNSSLLPSAHVVAVFCLTLFLLAPCCLAAVINDEGLAARGAVSVPFNDLLPPLTDAEFEKEQTTETTTTITTTTTTKRPPAIPAAPALKPKTTTTKIPVKSVKVQQQKLQKKIQQQLKSTTIPALDLSPEVPPNIQQATTEATTTAAATTPIKGSELKQAASAQHLQRVQAAQTQYKALQQQLQPQKQQQQKQLVQRQQIEKQQQAKQSFVKKPLLQQQQKQQQQQINIEQLQQYLNPTTRRPSRGALPTLTPFPRHLK